MTPLPRPPESMRPDRPEVMTSAGSGVVDGGRARRPARDARRAHNRARGLTTGIVTFGPVGLGPVSHAHLRRVDHAARRAAGGRGRGPALRARPARQRRHPPRHPAPAREPLGDRADRLPHRAGERRAHARRRRGHASQSGRCRTTRRASRAPSGSTDSGRPRDSEAGPEHVVHRLLQRGLLPGIEMSGGYGLFQPGGRLPAHVHDFDESICIIEGRPPASSKAAATRCPTARPPCSRAGGSTTSSTTRTRPMAMLWVYAGPRPERIVVDERCATVEGDPWREGATR